MSPVNDIDNRIAYQKHLPNRQSGSHILSGLNKPNKICGKSRRTAKKKPRRPHHPLIVQKTNIELIIHVLAVNTFHFVSIRSGRFRTSTEPTLHFAYIASIHLSTPRLRKILISISQAHSFRFPQAVFQRISSGTYLFLRRVSPVKHSSIFPTAL